MPSQGPGGGASPGSEPPYLPRPDHPVPTWGDVDPPTEISHTDDGGPVGPGDPDDPWAANDPANSTLLLRPGQQPAVPGNHVPAFLDALLDFVVANRTLIRALENRGPNAYYANPSSRYWIAELTRRISAACPDEDADYLAHVLFTALRADVVDYLMTSREMPLQRIRAGLHKLAGV